MRTTLIALLCALPFAGSVAQELSEGRFILLVDDAAKHCTTLIAQSDLEDAIEACDAAVDLARVPITTGLNPHGHNNREAMAIAYSNRAVLNWLIGDADAANADLARALRQNRHAEEIRHNQTLLAERYLASSDQVR